MAKEQLYEPYSIAVETMDFYPKRVKQNTFFELVYILSGKGRHCVNDNRFDYETDDMFLLTPDEKHGFDIDTTTQFFFLRFNDIYLHSNGILQDNIQRIEYLLYNAKQIPGSILQHETDKPVIKTIIETIIREQANRLNCWDALTLGLVNSLIILVGRSIALYLPQQLDDDKEGQVLEVLKCIQANIYHPKLIKAEAICTQFGISLSYLGRYFKKHTGQTMQDYIAHYKLKLIQNRLQYSKMRISDIVYELGFADESHLDKFFKKHTGLNPSQFRQQQSPNLVERIVQEK